MNRIRVNITNEGVTKMAKQLRARKADLEILAKVVEATVNESFVYTSDKEHARLVELGLVEINSTMTDESGNIATRATQAGIDKMNENAEMTETNDAETETAEATSTPAKSGFELESGIELPTVRRGGRGANVYPFDSMEVGHSFHVPKSEDKPNPAKSLASTVSSATARYKDEDGNVTRKFVVRSVGDNDPKGPGARVFRVE